MLSARELYYLNKALDGKKIFGIHPSESLIESINSDKSEEETLIEKKLLERDGSINGDSFLIINNLEKYKNANTYVILNNVLASIDRSEELVYLCKEISGQYILKKVLKPVMIYNLIKLYTFLCGNEPVEKYRKIIKTDNFIQEILSNKKENEWFHIKSGVTEKAGICNFYYIEDNKTYKYNAINNELIKINPKDIRLELMKIFKVEVK